MLPTDSSAEPTTEQVEARLAKLNALGASLATTRTEAIKARKASGIEDDWLGDEEHYEGIDDLNRHTKTSRVGKPPDYSPPKISPHTSTLFTNITRPYVDAAAAKVGDILLPTDERAWSLTKTPVQDLEDKAKGTLPAEAMAGMAEIGLPPEKIDQVRQAEAEEASRIMAEAEAKAEKAQKRIEDWHIEGQWHAEMRKVLDDCCKIGSGVLKGPVPVAKRAQMFKDGKLVVQDKIQPASKRVDPWNFFPDGACGESVHNGNYTWERDFITAKQLLDLKRDPEYVGSQIDECLREGPKKATDVRETIDGRVLDDKALFEIWYYHGFATRADLEAAGCDCGDKMVSVPAIFTMVNDRVIKGSLNPLDTGDFPYDVMPWQRRKNMPWGTGVARQIRTPQLIVLAGVRTMLTNAGRAAGPIFVLKQGVISPAVGSTLDIVPWAMFFAGEDDTTDDVSKAMTMFTIPSMQVELMNIIQFGLKMAEDVTGLPMLLQGQAGSAPETLGGQQLVQNNASGVLKRIARTVDDCITEPHVRRYYAWLLQYGEDDEKGDFVIDARGSTALVERDIYRQEVGQLLEGSLNPAFGLNPKKVMAEHLRASKKTPDKFQYTAEEEKQLAEQAQQQGADPRVAGAKEVATIRSDSEIKKANITATTDMEELKFKASEAEKQRQHESRMADRQERVEILKLSNAQNISVGEIKAQLAGKVFTLRSQEKLAGMKNAQGAPQVATPAAEPPGRAPEGQAFQR